MATARAKMFGKLRLPPLMTHGVAAVLPQPRFSMSNVKFSDNRIVLVSGFVGQYDVAVVTDETMVFAADGLSYTIEDPIPFGNSGNYMPGVILGDGRAIFIGGGPGYDKTQTLDPTTLNWTVQNDMITPANGSATLVVLQNGNALRLGGSGGTTDVEEYRQDTNTWETRTPMPTARAAPTAVVLANGHVMVKGFFDPPDIYDPVAQIWYEPANALQTGNNATGMVTLSNGKTLLMYPTFLSGPLGVILIDSYDPASNKFTPKTTMVDSWLGSSIYPSPAHEIGDGFITITGASGLMRSAYYDFRHDKWFSIFPAYPERWEGLFLQIDKNTFLNAGGAPGSFYGEGVVIPHAGARYVLRSTLIVNNKTPPTFGGLVSVEKGVDTDRAVLHWANASDDRTHPEDINYFVYPALSPGGQDYVNAYANTTGWAGTNSIELFGLLPDTDYYIVVRARDMLNAESTQNETTPPTPNFDGNTIEVLFHTPLSITAAPTFAWTPTQAMSEPRAGLHLIKLNRPDPSPNGDNGRLITYGGVKADLSESSSQDIYSQTGLSREKIGISISPRIEFASFEGSASINDGIDNRRATIVGGQQILNVVGTNEAHRYYPYQRSWYPLGGSGQFEDIPPANEYVARCAAVGLDTHDVLRIGGIATSTFPNDVTDTSSASNTLERMVYQRGDKITFINASGTFTVGSPVTGDTYGGSGVIEEVQQFGDTGFIKVSGITNFFLQPEIITDSFGASATVYFVQTNWPIQTWHFKNPMVNKRYWHSAITLNDGRILIAGGFDETGSAVRDIEIYMPSLDAWEIVYGYAVNYMTLVGAFTPGLYAADSNGSYAKIGSDDGSSIRFSKSVGTFQNGDSVSDLNIAFTNQINFWTYGATLTGGTSGAVATILATPETDFNDGIVVVDAATLSGTFIPGETITDGVFGTAEVVTVSGGAHAVVSGPQIEYVRPHAQFPLVKLADGKVMLIGGDSNAGSTSKVDIYDPAGPNTVMHAADLPFSRNQHNAHRFASDHVGVFGGFGATAGTAIADVRLYDPVADTWSHPSDMITPRYAFGSVLLVNNKVLVVGGYDDTDTPTDLAELSKP